ncbi:MAG: hypothetical protein AB7U48_14955 [Bauldia sp.]
MTTIDEIEELRAELRHTHLTANERREAEARLTQLLEGRDGPDHAVPITLPSNALPRRNGSTDT